MKSYTDLEQSRKLAEILPMDSADHHYVRKTCDFMGNPVNYPKYGNPKSKYASYIVQNFSNCEVIPCWSLAALLGVIPFCSLRRFVDGKWIVAAEFSFNGYRESLPHTSPIDACVELIEMLNEDGTL